MRLKSFRKWIFALSLITLSANAVTKVGNGDDGQDLEKTTPITSGAIFDARAKALQMVQSLNVNSISGLGQLIPEIETSQLLMVDRDSQSVDKDQADPLGRAYARTFAEPHAATRFYPIALKLDSQQLVALHIHEALHRSLPANQRENEEAVSQITLAIVSTGANLDRVQQTVVKYVPPEAVMPVQVSSAETFKVKETPENYAYSSFNYSYRAFQRPVTSSIYDSKSIQVMDAFLYPFGRHRTAFGFGITLSEVTDADKSFMGPLGVSARFQVYSNREFRLTAFAKAAINTASEDLKNTPLYRDVLSTGIEAHKESAYSYVQGTLTYYGSGQTKQSVGQIEYTYDYGSAIGAGLKFGARYKAFRAGLSTEVLVSDPYKVQGGAFGGYNSGRYRLFSGGPEIRWENNDMAITLYGRWLLDRTEESNFDYFGDLLGHGSGQGNVGLTFTLKI